MSSVKGKRRLGMDTSITSQTKIMVTVPWLLVYLLDTNNSQARRSKLEQMKLQDRAFHMLATLCKIGSASGDGWHSTAWVYQGSQVVIHTDGSLSFDEKWTTHVTPLEKSCKELLEKSHMIGVSTNHQAVLAHRPREWAAHHTLAGALWYWSWLSIHTKNKKTGARNTTMRQRLSLVVCWTRW
jgi:hypothetical protein